MRWVGLDNFAAIFRDGSFIQAIGNTVAFAAGFLVLGIPLSLVLAVLIHQGRVRGRGIALSLLFSTYVVPTVAVALLWGYLLSPRGGPVNELLKVLHLPIQPWLGSPRTALWSLVLLTIWQYLGYFTTILIAGLTQIPRRVLRSRRDRRCRRCPPPVCHHRAAAAARPHVRHRDLPDQRSGRVRRGERPEPGRAG